MKKSLQTRIRVTKRGKIIRRLMAVDHFRTRKTTKNIASKRKGVSLDYPRKKILNY
jgi:ribosomal protein L35